MENKKIWYAPHKFEAYGEEEINAVTECLKKGWLSGYGGEKTIGSLDDTFYSLPEYNANTDSRDYIDSARTELDYLKYVIEKEKNNLPEIKYEDIEINGC